MIQIGSLTKILPVKRGLINFVLDEQKTKFKQKRRNFENLNKYYHFIMPTPLNSLHFLAFRRGEPG